ncbi:MAG TPA: cbb3-type cytochrome c oxidase subunit I [Bacteroidota bacterium]
MHDLAVMYYALPRLRFGSDLYDQRRGKWAFWLLTLGLLSMTFALLAAAMVQITMERMEGVPFMETQRYLTLFFAIRFWSGAAMVVGFLLFLADLFALKPHPAEVSPASKRILAEHAL